VLVYKATEYKGLANTLANTLLFYRRVDVLAKSKSTGCARGSFLEKIFFIFQELYLRRVGVLDVW